VLLARFNLAVAAVERGGAHATPATDAFLATLTEALDEGAGAEAYEAIRAMFEGIPQTGFYETIVMTGHALGFGVLRSAVGPATVNAWLASDHPSACKAGVAGWSKVAEHDVDRVDVDALVELSGRLDEADEVMVGLLARMAGRLRDRPLGIRVIEAMAAQGESARINAAHAIAYDPRLDPPVGYFSAFGAAPPPASVAPARRLVWLLLSLHEDTSENVRLAAQQAIALALQSWPDDARHLAHLSMGAGSGPPEEGWIGPPEDDPVGTLDDELDRGLADLGARTGQAWTRADLPRIRQQVLDRSVSGPRRARGVEYALRFPQLANRRAGFLTWNPATLDAGAPRAIRDGPRLFLSYRWSQEIEVNTAVDSYASRLCDLGYDIVFDRDPRHLDKQLNATDVLLLLPGCTHIVLLVTDELAEFARGRPHDPPSPLDLEWDLAQQLTDLRWLGIWHAGDELPSPLTPDRVADMRENPVGPMTPLFPECRLRVTAAETRDVTERPSAWTS
jgi:hypothetical protein